MKKVLASSVVVLMVLFLSVGFGLAGKGGGGGTGGGIVGGGGAGGGTGPIHDIMSGTPFTVGGIVDGIVAGGGVGIATGEVDEYGEPIIVTIYGIGPVRYWVSLGVDHPLVGDAIEVSGYVVDYTTLVSRNIAMEITVEGVKVELRDSDTGVPLWRGSGGNKN